MSEKHKRSTSTPVIVTPPPSNDTPTSKLTRKLPPTKYGGSYMLNLTPRYVLNLAMSPNLNSQAHQFPSKIKHTRNKLSFDMSETLPPIKKTPQITLRAQPKAIQAATNKPLPEDSNRQRIKKRTQEPRYVNIVSRCAFKSRVGSVMNQPKRYNQDNFIISHKINNIPGQYLFAVCDGHGAVGHHVTGIIKDELPRHVSSLLSELPMHSHSPDSLKDLLKEAARLTDLDILNSGFDVSYSGSTLIAILICGSLMITCNVGDSRAVLGRKNSDTWESVQLSEDHKPELPSERDRILANNGRIDPCFNSKGEPVGPLRVWIKNDKVPGLAMTRALGDTVARKAGVISEPEMGHRFLDENDRFIVLASDGIWHIFSSYDCIDIISDCYESNSPDSCCDVLVREAVNKWSKTQHIIDDITAVVIFLKNKTT